MFLIDTTNRLNESRLKRRCLASCFRNSFGGVVRQTVWRERRSFRSPERVTLNLMMVNNCSTNEQIQLIKFR